MNLFSAGLIEPALSSPVLTAIVTGTFAVGVTLVTYLLSTKKSSRKKRLFASKTNGHDADRVTYATYETLIKQLHEEIERLRSVAADREQLIEILRTKEIELYKVIDHKNDEISKLRHSREFIERAQEITAEDQSSKR